MSKHVYHMYIIKNSVLMEQKYSTLHDTNPMTYPMIQN